MTFDMTKFEHETPSWQKKSVNCLGFFTNVLPFHRAMSVFLTYSMSYLLKSLIRTTTSNKSNKERTKYTLELHPLVQTF